MTTPQHGGWMNAETHAMAARLDNVETDYMEASRLTAAYAPRPGRDVTATHRRGLAFAMRTRFGGAFGDAVDWRGLAAAWLDEYVTDRDASNAAPGMEPDAYACVCCAFAIANGDGCECDPGTHPDVVGGAPMGAWAVLADDDSDWHFSGARCDVCGSTLAGDRAPVVALDVAGVDA